MKIMIADAHKGIMQPLPFSFVTTAEAIDAVHPEYSFPGDIRVEGKAEFTGSAWRVSGVISCEKAFVCDRCLGSFKEHQEHEFAEEFQHTPADGDVNVFEGDYIDISGLVRDTILAAQPMKSLCRPDCRGLCPKCGADLNKGDGGCDRFVPDPRLADLQQLLKK